MNQWGQTQNMNMNQWVAQIRVHKKTQIFKDNINE